MKIIIKDTLNLETVLCDGPGRGRDRNVGPLDDGVVIDDQVTMQLAEYLRAPAAKAFNRKNQRTSIAFRVSRECESLTAAHAWQVSFHSSCIRAGTLILIETLASGAEKRVNVPDVVITSIKTNPLGVTRLVTFQIVGGPLTA